MRLSLLTFISILIYVQVNTAEIDEHCQFPWLRLNDNICLFLTSTTKTWDHAKFLCKFYGGDLLYIKNDIEQKLIQKYFSKLIKYRFNQKPYVWLDATDKQVESEWKWSRNNQTVAYQNWMPQYHNNRINSDSLDCSCFKPTNGYWKDCDCSLTQHFSCRKSMPFNQVPIMNDETPEMDGFSTDMEIHDPEQEMNLQIILTEQTKNIEDTLKKDFEKDKEIQRMMNDEVDIDEPVTEFESEIVLSEPLNEINKLKKKFNERAKSKAKASKIDDHIDMEILLNETDAEKDKRAKEELIKERISSKMNLLRFKPKMPTKKSTPVNNSINLMRMMVLKSNNIYSKFHCPQGLGYYLIENSRCEKYKRCENWNPRFASLSVNKCPEGVFDFDKLTCVPRNEYNCDDTVPKFVQE